jgi:hypothetical protein
MTRLKDPIHFFDALGRSVLTQDFLGEELAKAKAENAELKKKLKTAVDRIRKMTEEADDQSLAG